MGTPLMARLVARLYRRRGAAWVSEAVSLVGRPAASTRSERIHDIPGQSECFNNLLADPAWISVQVVTAGVESDHSAVPLKDPMRSFPLLVRYAGAQIGNGLREHRAGKPP